VDCADPRALTSFGDREATEPWSWHGPARSVTAGSWGGCLEVIEWVLTAGRFPVDAGVLDGGVLILDTSEELLPPRNVGWIVRALGERGIRPAVDAVLVARAPVSDFVRRPTRRGTGPAAGRATRRRCRPDRPVQPRRRDLCGRSVRSHSAAVDCRVSQ